MQGSFGDPGKVIGSSHGHIVASLKSIFFDKVEVPAEREHANSAHPWQVLALFFL